MEPLLFLKTDIIVFFNNSPNKYDFGGTAKKVITEKGKIQADVDTSVKGVT